MSQCAEALPATGKRAGRWNDGCIGREPHPAHVFACELHLHVPRQRQPYAGRATRSDDQLWVASTVVHKVPPRACAISLDHAPALHFRPWCVVGCHSRVHSQLLFVTATALCCAVCCRVLCVCIARGLPDSSAFPGPSSVATPGSAVSGRSGAGGSVLQFGNAGGWISIPTARPGGSSSAVSMPYATASATSVTNRGQDASGPAAALTSPAVVAKPRRKHSDSEM